jgi:hypothetical protein
MISSLRPSLIQAQKVTVQEESPSHHVGVWAARVSVAQSDLLANSYTNRLVVPPRCTGTGPLIFPYEALISRR